MNQPTYPRIGDLLAARGLITPEQLSEALEEQKRTGRRLGDILVAQGRISSTDLVDILSERLGLPKITIRGLTADPEVVNIIPLPTAKRHRVVPLFKIKNRLTVAMADPLDMVAIDEVRYKTGLLVNRVVATPEDIDAAIAQFYTVADSVERVISDMPASGGGRGTPITAEDAPIVRLVEVLLSEAIKQKTSDLHIEPAEGLLRVRFRVDGVLREEAQPPANLHPAIVSRIKVLAGMDVSEKRIPQDGRFAMTVGNQTVDLRVSTIPTVHGEKVVVRVLGRHGIELTLESLGLSGGQLELLRSEIHATEGMILISGPTSSGKTTTLYAALKEITTPEKNVVTVEDPVEYALPLVNQVQVNEKAGLTFPICLRAFMRQNPDIIMVGEVRDGPTAQIAVRAAMTGHLVLSTIHTIDAAAAPLRLVDVGVEPFLVATALRAVVAQRLARRLCNECAVVIDPSPAVGEQLGFDMLSDMGIWRKAVGCRMCRGTGYAGQVGIYEVFNVDDAIRRMVAEGHNAAQLREHLRARGYQDLQTQGRALVAGGLTTAGEVLRVIPRRSEVWEAIA
ncbi:MAG: ATPase, T2SS/T4P/T4SS family [Candidatus Zixiibacteriota bacterium]